MDIFLNPLEERFLGGGVAGAFKDKNLEKIFKVLTGDLKTQEDGSCQGL